MASLLSAYIVVQLYRQLHLKGQDLLESDSSVNKTVKELVRCSRLKETEAICFQLLFVTTTAIVLDDY